MNQLSYNVIFYSGLLILIAGLLMLIQPPKYNNFFFGVRTKWTTYNQDTWKDGQKYFAYSYIFIGLLYFVLSFLGVQNKVPGFTFILLILVLSRLSIFIVNKMLASKYGEKV